MRDWLVFVREQLPLTGLTPVRQQRIHRELAAQLEDFYRDARSGGADDAAAERYATLQIADWKTFAADVSRADSAHRQPRIERVTDALEARGLPPAAPGLPSQPRLRGGVMLAQTIRDIRYALRQLGRSPGFTTVALLTLALGIGATTAVFSVVDGVLLQPLPFARPNALVRVHEIIPNIGRFSVAPANLFDWQKQNAVFERVAGYGTSSATFVGEGGPERIQGMQVTADFFPMLGVPPMLGTLITPDEDRPGAPKVVVLGYAFWQTHFGGDPKVVGTTTTLNGVPTTVIGVMPASFYFPNRTVNFWTAFAFNPTTATRGGHFIGVVARLKAGATVDQAQANMRSVAEGLARQYPKDSVGESAEVVPLQDQIVGAVRPALLVLFAAVGVVVLIVCANIANLLLVRAAIREKEMAIRASLGAGRRRLLVQVLAESLVLAGLGGALGVALGYFALEPIKTLSAGSVPRMADVAIDGRVMAFAALATAVTGILFGLAPAWQASRTSVNAVLKQSGRSSTGSGWMRRGLLVAEVALSVVLLAGAALVLRSFAKIVNVDPGFRSDRVLAFQVSLPGAVYKETPQTLAAFEKLAAGLENKPGVESAALVQTLPMRGDYNLSFSIRGVAQPADQPQTSASYRSVSARYFETLSIPILRGRTFAAQDTSTAEHVAIVDSVFAKTYFHDVDPIGQALKIGNGAGDAPYTIVGISGDVHYSGLDAISGPTMYVPMPQDPFSSMWVLVRAKGDAAALGATARDALRSVDQNVPAYSMNPLTTIVSDSVGQRRFSLLLLVSFAGLALFLAGVGLYGVVGYSVGQRTREIGLRLAIGAQPSRVLGMVVWDGMKLALIGVAVGLVASFLLSQLVKSMLFEVSPSDIVSHLATAAVLLVVTAIACYVPARRAMRVDPMVALQAE
jgi:putative ABC transport system permease protein